MFHHRCKMHLLLQLLIFVISIPAYSGTFKDRDGNIHTWSVTSNLSLQWDGNAYIPFGFVFTPNYLSDSQSDENLASDRATLEALKSKGITDIFLRPGKGIGTTSAEAFQRIIDLLEELGFCYGIQLVNPYLTHLSGYVIDPVVNRIENIQGSGDQTINLPDAINAIYVVADAKTGSVKHMGKTSPVNGVFTIPVTLRTNAAHVMLFFPYKVKESTVDDPVISDIWSDYERFRDLAVSYLSTIKFGKGLRFFADPFGDVIGLSGEAAKILPVSDQFRLDYAAWLAKKYPAIGSLINAWGMVSHKPKTFLEAAGYIPLWNSGKGVKYMYDPLADSTYEANADRSSFWADFQAFRESSIREYLDRFADVIKRQVADVPVIHTVNGLSPLFQVSSSHGYDGLACATAGGEDITMRAGLVLSMAENSPRSTWLISKITPSSNASAQKDTFFGTLNTLHSLGSKGFIIDGLPLAQSEAIQWMGEYASLSRNDGAFVNYMPRVIYYNVSAAKTEVKKLAGGAWWIPTLAAGRSLYLGDSMAGYVLDADVGAGKGIYIWSLNGNQVIHVDSENPITITKTTGETIEVAPNKKGLVEITVGTDPIIVRGIPAEHFMPIEIVMQAMKELTETILIAEEKRMDTSAYVASFNQAKMMMDKNKNYLLALQICQDATAELKHRLQGLTGLNPATMGASEMPSKILSDEAENK